MLSVTSVNGYNPYFKANVDNEAKKVPMRAVSRRAQQPKDERSEYEKKVRRAKIARAVTTGAGVLGSLALVTLLVMQIVAMRKGGNGMSELNALTDAPIVWTNFKGKNKVAPLSSETTHKVVRDECGKLVALQKLSEKAKKRAGIKGHSRIYYVFGESGTGKSYCVQQTAQELGANYTSIRYGEIGSPFKDAGSMKTLNMLRNIKSDAKANPNELFVVCVDEGDALVRKITTMASDEASKSRSSFLTGIDEIVDECPNVSFFITSNYHPDSKLIDRASMRRVHYKIEVPLADKDQTDAMLKLYLKDVEGIKPGFYDSNEYKNFVKELVNGKYSNGEIQEIAENAADEFGVKFVNMSDADVDKQFFLVDYLKKAKELYGQAAAVTSDTMLH